MKKAKAKAKLTDMKLDKYKIQFTDSIFKVAIAIVFIVLLVSIFYISKRPYSEQLHEGDISLTDIYSLRDFSYQAGVDETITNKKQREAQEATDEVFDKVDTEQKIVPVTDNIFKCLDEINKLSNLNEQERIDKFKKEINLPLSDTAIKALFQTENISKFKEDILRIIKESLLMGILKDSDKEELSRLKKSAIIIRDTASKMEQKVNLTDVLVTSSLKKDLEPIITNIIKEHKIRAAASELLLALLEPNLTKNTKETNLRKDFAIKNIIPEYRYLDVKKNELIVGKGQRVTHDILLKLEELEKGRPKTSNLLFLFGITILVILFLLIVAVYLKIFEPNILTIKNIILLGVIILLSVLLIKLILNSSLSNYLIPLASGSMLIAMLIDPKVALISTVVVSTLAGIITGYKFNITIVFLISGLVSVYSLNKAKRRSQLLIGGLLVGMANFFVVFGLGILNDLNYNVYISQGLWGLCGGILSSFIVIGSLPVFESLFDITTSISLLELSNLNHPLLKELFYKAPGTYHHSLSVGNLAEAACDAIGANSLLAKVGAYYHDIGKLKNAEYFSENQTNIKSRHEKLTPTMSRLIITNHVKDGVELANKFKIKNAIIDFIKEHHGTGLIFYFYQRALEEAQDEKLLEEEGFRYPGPKPQTKEAAIVLLADSIEAASRTLNNPAPLAIKELVHRIINNKFIDGQFDECDLTLKDIYTISSVFTRILTSMFHSRVEYPSGSNNANHKH